MTEEGSTTHSARSPITSRRMLGLLSNLDHPSVKRKTPALGRLGFRMVIGCLVASRADKLQLTIGHVVVASGSFADLRDGNEGDPPGNLARPPKRKGPGGCRGQVKPLCSNLTLIPTRG